MKSSTAPSSEKWAALQIAELRNTSFAPKIKKHSKTKDKSLFIKENTNQVCEA